MDTVFDAVVRSIAEYPSQVGRDVSQSSDLNTHRSDTAGDAVDDQVVDVLVGIGTAVGIVGSYSDTVGSTSIVVQYRDDVVLVASADERDGVDRHKGGLEVGVDIIYSTDDETIIGRIVVPQMETNHERVDRSSHFGQSCDTYAIEI